VSAERQTGRVRIYLPATLDELDATGTPAPFTSGDRAPGSFGPRIVHAVTPALRAALPDEDDDGLEFAALLAAADDALLRVAASPDAPRLRLVLALDVPDADLTAVDDDELAPSAALLPTAVGRDDIVCAHVDEPAASAEVERAVAGDVGAAERLADRDLLWYDATELSAIPR
jgi:hypothetical protein